jgi:hypothetical protein
LIVNPNACPENCARYPPIAVRSARALRIDATTAVTSSALSTKGLTMESPSL